MSAPVPASRAARLETLRELLRQRDVLPIQPRQGALSSGWPALDALLPGGGFPRGALSEVRGALGSGRITLLLRAVAGALGRGEPVAWISGRGPLYAPALREVVAPAEGLLQVCPPDPARVAWAAEQVLRSDTFTLVLLDAVHPAGSPALQGAGAHRLAGAARAAGGALVVLGEPPGLPIAADVCLSVRPVPAPLRRRKVEVTLLQGRGLPPGRRVVLEV